MSHGDLLVPLLDVGVQGVVELLVDHKDVLDLVEDGFDLLDGEHRLGAGGCCLQGTHGLESREKEEEEEDRREERA